MNPTPESPTQEVLAGLVERVTFHNAENGFCVIRAKARGHRDLVTVVGHAATISAGEWITASGEWINDRAHGQQFKARFLKTSAPSSIDGIEKYLGSGMIRGIGPVYAKKMVKAFGETVFDVIEAEPHRLREVTGIGAVRAKRITDAWAEQKIVREIMVFLHSNGVGTARAVRIFKTYGADAVQVMTENPYRLARDIRGIGFKSADAIAMKLGIEKTAMIRLRAGISYALTEAMDEGHCGLPTDQLIPLAEELLEAPKELILTALELETFDGAVIADTVGDTACIFLAGLYRAEQTIAERLIRIVSGRLPWPWIDEEKAAPWIEKRTGLQLADSQRAAIRLALTAKALVITGGPGVGKTTIVNSILKILAAKGVRLLLCAPTGRAAKRMTEATRVEAKTIHRLLEVDPQSGGFKRNADKPLECDLLVVDEASMVDVMLRFFVEFAKGSARLYPCTVDPQFRSQRIVELDQVGLCYWRRREPCEEMLRQARVAVGEGNDRAGRESGGRWHFHCVSQRHASQVSSLVARDNRLRRGFRYGSVRGRRSSIARRQDRALMTLIVVVIDAALDDIGHSLDPSVRVLAENTAREPILHQRQERVPRVRHRSAPVRILRLRITLELPAFARQIRPLCIGL